MKNIYYAIWADAIINIKKNPMHKKDWKAFSLFYISIGNALNFWLLFLFSSNSLGFKLSMLNLSIFPIDSLNSFFSFFIQFWLPFIPLNYFLILHKNRYKQLIKKYSDSKVKFFPIYFIGSLALCVIFVAYYASINGVRF